jgi:hypothetical protein
MERYVRRPNARRRRIPTSVSAATRMAADEEVWVQEEQAGVVGDAGQHHLHALIPRAQRGARLVQRLRDSRAR